MEGSFFLCIRGENLEEPDIGRRGSPGEESISRKGKSYGRLYEKKRNNAHNLHSQGAGSSLRPADN